MPGGGLLPRGAPLLGALAPAAAFAQTGIGRLIGEDGRARQFLGASGEFFFFLCLAGGFAMAGYGLYEGIMELRKDGHEKKEWRKPGWLVFGGSLLMGAEWLWTLLLRTVWGPDLPISDPFPPGPGP